MAFDVNKPADTQTIALGPADIRENFRALKEDKIVAAATAEISTDAQAHINDTTDAHMGSAIGITATAYGKGLSTAETTVQKVADRVNQNGTPQFVTDASKCSLLLDFKDGLVDKTRGIVPVNYNSAVKWTDNFVNDSTSKEVATNISATLKQFEGDEGLFGSGVAVEESRTNLFTYSEDLTQASIWIRTNSAVVLDRTLPDGRKLFKVTALADGDFWIAQNQTETSGNYTVSAFVINNSGKTFELNSGTAALETFGAINKLTRISSTYIGTNQTIAFYIGIRSATAGDTFYISSPQNEAGAFPTSYIATGATAVTRPAGNLQYAEKLNATEGSLSFWYKPHYKYNDLIDNADIPVLFEYDNNSRANIFNLTYRGRISDGANQYKFALGNGANELFSSAYNASTFNDKEFHFAVKWNASNISLYINGLAINSITKTAFTADALLRLGNIYNNAGFKANGTISNFEIFNYALSADEISQIYNSGLEGKPVVCVNPVNHQDIIREYSGTPNGNIMPMFFGESVYDSTNNIWYKSKKIDNSTFVNPAWLQLN